MTLAAKITSTGAYLPIQKVSNHDLSKTLDTSHEWIFERTGISSRHIAAKGELTSDLAVAAAKQALDRAGLSPQGIDLIVVATTTPDRTFPSTAVAVQHKLGCRTIGAFDVQAVCSGFLYALAIANNFIKAGGVKHALVIGAETFSRIVDWQDRGTAILFGDGAGAVILSAAEVKDLKTDPGVIDCEILADGKYQDLLYVDGGPSLDGQVGKVKMQGREVFKHAVQLLADVSIRMLQKNRIDPSQIDWVVPHQANRRIIEASAEKAGIDPARCIITMENTGNTSAASIPLALHQAFVVDKKIKAGDLLLLQALGGGFTWGAALIRL